MMAIQNLKWGLPPIIYSSVKLLKHKHTQRPAAQNTICWIQKNRVVIAKTPCRQLELGKQYFLHYRVLEKLLKEGNCFKMESIGHGYHFLVFQLLFIYSACAFAFFLLAFENKNKRKRKMSDCRNLLSYGSERMVIQRTRCLQKKSIYIQIYVYL